MSSLVAQESLLSCLKNLLIHANAEDIEIYLERTDDPDRPAPPRVSRLYSVLAHLVVDLRGRAGDFASIESVVECSSLNALIAAIKDDRVKLTTRSAVVDYLFSIPGIRAVNIKTGDFISQAAIRSHEDIRLHALSHPLLHEAFLRSIRLQPCA